jgi:hypothetical protein
MARAITQGIVFPIAYNRLCSVDYLTWSSLIFRHIAVDIAAVSLFEKIFFSYILEVDITYTQNEAESLED